MHSHTWDDSAACYVTGYLIKLFLAGTAKKNCSCSQMLKKCRTTSVLHNAKQTPRTKQAVQQFKRAIRRSVWFCQKISGAPSCDNWGHGASSSRMWCFVQSPFWHCFPSTFVPLSAGGGLSRYFAQLWIISFRWWTVARWRSAHLLLPSRTVGQSCATFT